jgi:hypothetical protein
MEGRETSGASSAKRLSASTARSARSAGFINEPYSAALLGGVFASWSVFGRQEYGSTTVHTPEEQPRDGGDLQQEVQVENVEDHRADRPRATITIVIRHIDISGTISIGPWNLSGSLGRVLQALEANLPELLRTLEAGVPEERRAPLSRASVWHPIYRQRMALSRVVPDWEDWR